MENKKFSFDSLNNLPGLSEEMAGLMDIVIENELLTNPAYMMLFSMKVCKLIAVSDKLKEEMVGINGLLKQILIEEGIDIPDTFDKPREFTAIFRPKKEDK